MPPIHAGSGGEAAAMTGIRARTIATTTIPHARARECPGLDRCRCEGGTDESGATVPLYMSSRSGTNCRAPHYRGLIRPSSERETVKAPSRGTLAFAVWYQKRFLPSGQRDKELFHLDLKPDILTDSRAVPTRSTRSVGWGFATALLPKVSTRLGLVQQNQRR